MLPMLNQVIFQTKKSNINPSMKVPLLYLLFLASFFSCQKKENKTGIEKNKTTSTIQIVSDKVFIIASQLDTEQCIAYSDGCDCCEGRIVFLKNGTFISNFYCIPEETYDTGTYEVEKASIKLHYSSKSVVLNSEEEINPDGKSILTLQKTTGGNSVLGIIKCKNKLVFKSDLDDYFSEDKTISFNEAINQYKKSGVWKLLEMKK
jgi:hypothetical protein